MGHQLNSVLLRVVYNNEYYSIPMDDIINTLPAGPLNPTLDPLIQYHWAIVDDTILLSNKDDYNMVRLVYGA